MSIETATPRTAQRPWRRARPSHTASPTLTHRAPQAATAARSSGAEGYSSSSRDQSEHCVPFDTLGLHPAVVKGVGSRGFVVTTPIQAQVIPLARDGGDIIACAETGTGKTAAFVLPILDKLIRERESANREPEGSRHTPQVRGEASALWGEASASPGTPQVWGEASASPGSPQVWGEASASPGTPQVWGEASASPGTPQVWGEASASPGSPQVWGEASASPGQLKSSRRRTRVLIVAPTRELAAQVDDDITGFAYHTSIRSAVVCGGLPSEPQERALQAGVDIVVATPGRLMDHMRQGVTDFSALEVLVLDEADRMLDMGFWPDIQRIVEALPRERQTLLLSATMPEEVVRLANEVVRNPRMVGKPRANKVATTISHAIEEVSSAGKAEWLARFLRREPGPVLVFVRTKRGADRLADRLKSAGVRCAPLHADLSQPQRTSAVEGFRAGRFKALVATDLAARGLDIHGITHVINFEVPSTKEAYVHRVGRTGRAEALGTAITLVAPEERRALAALEREVGVDLRARN